MPAISKMIQFVNGPASASLLKLAKSNAPGLIHGIALTNGKVMTDPDGVGSVARQDNDGSNAAVIFWDDEAAMKAFTKTAEFTDVVSQARHFSVAQPATDIVQKTTGKDYKAARAVLCIQGILAGECTSSKEFWTSLSADQHQESGEFMGSIPGVIIKHFLQGDIMSGDAMEDRLCGGCYLFESSDDIDAYISGDIWKAGKDMAWDEISVEKYDIVLE